MNEGKEDNASLLNILNSLPDLYLIVDPDLIIRHVSDAYLKSTFQSRDNLIGKPFFDAFPDNHSIPDPDGVQNLKNSFQQVLLYGKPHQMPVQRYDVLRSTAKGGTFEKKYWSPVNVPVFGKNGEVSHIIHKVTDITEVLDGGQTAKDDIIQNAGEILKREKKAFKLAELQRSQVVNTFMQAPVVLAIFKGPNHIAELVNEAACHFWGVKKREIEGKPIFEVLPELVSQGTKERLDSVFETGKPNIGRKIPVYLSNRKERVYFNVVSQVMKNLEGEHIGVITVASDVSEEVKAIQQAEKSKQEFLALADSIPHLVWKAEADGYVNYCNQRWNTYTGLSKEETLGWGWVKAIHPQHVPRAQEKWQEALQKGVDLFNEYKIRRADGSYRWFRVVAVAVREAGKVVKWYGTLTDIDEEKEYFDKQGLLTEELAAKNEELQRINNDLDNFVYTASHDLKAPITNLEGLFDLFLEDVVLTKENSQLEKMIKRSFTRFKNTLRDLTEIAKIERDSSEDVQAINIEDILDETRYNIYPLIEETGAEIISDLQLKKVRFSRKNMRSILYNFISNGIKYRHPDRQPVVRVKSSLTAEREVLLQFSDNGLGMAAAQQAKIFKMFTRLHSHVEGSGVGLYIVKRIVDNAGGRIEVDSQLEEGTTFRVYLRQGMEKNPSD